MASAFGSPLRGVEPPFFHNNGALAFCQPFVKYWHYGKNSLPSPPICTNKETFECKTINLVINYANSHT